MAFTDFLDSPQQSQADSSSGGFNDFLDAPNDQPQNNPSGRVFPQGQTMSSRFGPLPIVDTGASKALFTNEPVGFVGGILRSAPTIAGAGIAGPVGAGALEAVRQGAVGLNSALGNTEAPTIADATLRPVMAGLTQKAADVAAPYVESGIQKVAGALGTGTKNGIEWLATNLQGVKPQSYGIDAASPESTQAVRSYVGAEPSVGDQLAQNVRDIVGKSIEGGEKAYPQLIEAAQQNPAYAGKTFNLQQALGDKVLEIADSHQLMESPGLKSTPGTQKFWNFAGQVDNLKSASLDQVYSFQKQLNSLASDNAGTPLGSAFGKLKDAVKSYLGEQVPEIGQANSQYAAAKALEEQTGKLTGANDLLDFVIKTNRNPQMTLAKQALADAAEKVPGLGDALDQIHAYQAAKDFTPLIRSLPQTGMGAGIVKAGSYGAAALGGGLALHNPLVAGAGAGIGAAIGTLTSPRMALAALEASQAMAGTSQLAAQGAKAATPILSQAFAQMSPQSIAAFYKSPGAKP